MGTPSFEGSLTLPKAQPCQAGFVAATQQEGRAHPIATHSGGHSFRGMQNHAMRLLGKNGFAHREQKYHSLAPSLRDCFKFSLEMWNCREPQEAEQRWRVKSTVRRVRLQFPTQIHCSPLTNVGCFFFLSTGLQPLMKSFNQQCTAQLQTCNQTFIHPPMYSTRVE